MPTSASTIPGTPASRVMELVRCLGMAKRDELTRRPGLSAATVARATTALVEVGLLRYGAGHDGHGVGRPGVRVRIDDRRFAVVGIHLGRRATTVALGDLTGRVIARIVEARRNGDLSRLSPLVSQLLAAHPDRRPLSAGVVAPWRELTWDRVAVTARIHDLLGLDIANAEHIEAMAHAEFLGVDPEPGTTAFVYARETAGFLTVGDQASAARHHSLNHFPTGTAAECDCGRSGCLVASAGDEAIARAAYAAGWIKHPRIDAVFRAAAAGDGPAQESLRNRARILADVISHVIDMVEPDRVVIAGQAFSADPRVATLARDLANCPVSVTRFGADIQASAACAVALRPVDNDPLGLAPRLCRTA